MHTLILIWPEIKWVLTLMPSLLTYLNGSSRWKESEQPSHKPSRPHTDWTLTYLYNSSNDTKCWKTLNIWRWPKRPELSPKTQAETQLRSNIPLNSVYSRSTPSLNTSIQLLKQIQITQQVKRSKNFKIKVNETHDSLQRY